MKRRLVSEWGCTTGDATRKTVNGVKYHGVVWPPLIELRARFEAKFGPQQWSAPHVEEWTAHGQTFSEAEKSELERVERLEQMKPTNNKPPPAGKPSKPARSVKF